MSELTIHRKYFTSYFSDAYGFAKLATEPPEAVRSIYQSQQRFTRTSVLASALALECAANCCLDILGLEKQTTQDFEQLRTLAKFEAFLNFHSPGRSLNREHALVRPVSNLVSCRNQYVHSKVLLEQIVDCQIRLPKWEPLGLPKNQAYWHPLHAVKAFTCLSDFLNFLFFDLCGFPYMGGRGRSVVASILTSAISPGHGFEFPIEGTYAPIMDATALVAFGDDEWDLEYAFLGTVKTGPGDKQITPKRKWGDYSHCDVSQLEIPMQHIGFRTSSGIGVVSIGDKKAVTKFNEKMAKLRKEDHTEPKSNVEANDDDIV